ncbi:hypothetical protein JXQ31_19635 [candidate division KSB1 bacterium]|nr:hypothetical protein [candidate division KSB1 bacterium]
MDQQQSKLKPAVWGGLFIGVITGVPILNLINCFCCVGVIGGGILSVYLYRNSLKEDQIMSMSDGVAIGLLAGVLGAFSGAILNGIFGAMTRDILEFASKYIDNPQIDEILYNITAAQIAKGFFLLNILGNLLIDCVFGLIGGMIGFAIYGKAKMV